MARSTGLSRRSGIKTAEQPEGAASKRGGAFSAAENGSKAFGDQVLVQMGESLRSMIRSEGGIVSRRNADTFLVYCPHREDYQAILDGVIKALPTRNNGSRIRLRVSSSLSYSSLSSRSVSYGMR